MAGCSRQALRTTALVVAVLAGGCSDGMQLPRIQDLNPFAEKEVPLPGKRIPVALSENKAGLDVAAADKPIVLPAARTNDAWSQPGGTANNAPGHLALAANVKQVWSADAGQGTTKTGRLTAGPIVADGRVLTLDTAGRVTAFSAAGQQVWRASVVPDKERPEKGYGGGLAADAGRVYAATGFGYVFALDSSNGKKLWEKNLSSPMRTAPTTAGGKVIVVCADGIIYALSGDDGSEVWKHQGLPEKAAILANATPAVDGDVVVVPFPSGDIIALRLADGQQLWSESLARTRVSSSLGSMTDAGRPAIDAGIVFAVGHSGRMIATNARTGERLWSLNVPGIQAPAVAGDMVFVVDTSGQLMAITRREGKILYTTKLPNATTWSGPVVAGNKLWLTSNKGQLLGVDAATGKPDGQQDLGSPVYSAPIVAGGRMFVLTDKARLIALN